MYIAQAKSMVELLDRLLNAEDRSEGSAEIIENIYMLSRFGGVISVSSDMPDHHALKNAHFGKWGPA